jgi:hypothetical protein
MGMAVASAPAQYWAGPVIADYRSTNRDRLLATPPPFPHGRADDTRRPGFNGRLWVGENFTNGFRNPLAWGDPGPTYFGSSDRHAPTAFVRIGTQAIAISPWISLDSQSFPTHEAGRGLWLREQGFTGGVRTHVHPSVIQQVTESDNRHASADTGKSSVPQPRATIRVIPTLGDPQAVPARRQRDVAAPQNRYSWPASAPAAVVARTTPMDPIEQGQAVASLDNK